VDEIRENDILMGRGAPTINYKGNVSFRELVSTRKAEYTASGRHRVKDEIARQVIEEIARRDGRFLRRIETTAEAEALGMPNNKKAWIIAEDSIAMEKVKQALRDKDPAVPPEPPSEAITQPVGQGLEATLPFGSSFLSQGLGNENLPILSNAADLMLSHGQDSRVPDYLQQNLLGRDPLQTSLDRSMLEQQYTNLLLQQLRQQQQGQGVVASPSVSPPSGLQPFSDQTLLVSPSRQDILTGLSLLPQAALLSEQQFLSGNVPGGRDGVQFDATMQHQRDLFTNEAHSLLSRYQDLLSQHPIMRPISGSTFGTRNLDNLSERSIESVLGLNAQARNSHALSRNSNGMVTLTGTVDDSVATNQDMLSLLRLSHDSRNTVALDAPQLGMLSGLGSTSTGATPVDSLLATLLRQRAGTNSFSSGLFLTPAASFPAAGAASNDGSAPLPKSFDSIAPGPRTTNIHPFTSNDEEDSKPRAKQSSDRDSVSSSSSSSTEEPPEEVRKRARTSTGSH
jgi:hypothetical protein